MLYLVTIVKYLISAYFYVHEKVFVVLSIPFLRKSMLYFFFPAVQIELFTVCFFTHWHC